MKKTYFKHIVLALTLTTAAVACTKDDEDVNSPSFKIKQSESLTIPTEVELPANNNGYNRVATLYAEGVQKYKAQLKAGTTATYEWVLSGPKADLFNLLNEKVGTHTAGPTWQLHGASDSIYAQQMAPPRTAPSTEPNTIDWLLLIPKVGKTATGFFSNVAFIQRIATKGGKAPATPPVNPTDTIDVFYTAIYRFSSAK